MIKNFVVAAMALSIAMSITSCTKEKIEQKVEDIVVQVMVDGVWIVTNYQEGTDNYTSQFAGWESQFFEDRTCVARKPSTGTIVNGTWEGSYSAQSMMGNFNNVAPINKLNGTWKIIRSTYTVGQFSRMESGKEYKLEITKK